MSRFPDKANAHKTWTRSLVHAWGWWNDWQLWQLFETHRPNRHSLPIISIHKHAAVLTTSPQKTSVWSDTVCQDRGEEGHSCQPWHEQTGLRCILFPKAHLLWAKNSRDLLFRVIFTNLHHFWMTHMDITVVNIRVCAMLYFNPFAVIWTENILKKSKTQKPLFFLYKTYVSLR